MRSRSPSLSKSAYAAPLEKLGSFQSERICMERMDVATKDVQYCEDCSKSALRCWGGPGQSAPSIETIRDNACGHRLPLENPEMRRALLSMWPNVCERENSPECSPPKKHG